ncbi:MAG: energy transducer TonB [Gammaproteobacteria bacterium]|nr:energy transducer TonB [Gammaproteobacteria bacterium]
MLENFRHYLILAICCFYSLLPMRLFAEDHALCKTLDQDVAIVERQQPAFPYFAALYCVEGWVRLEFTINTIGRAEDITVLDSSAPGVFDSVTNAVEHWKFLPRCVEGEPVKQTATQVIDFALASYNVEQCQTAIPEQLLDTLINLASIRTELTEKVNNNQSIDDYLPLTAVGSDELGQLEQIHLDHMAKLLEMRVQWYQLYSENNDIDALIPLLSPAYLEADVDFNDAQQLVSSVQQSIVSRWQTYLQLNAQFRQTLHEVATELSDLDTASRAILIDNSITSQLAEVEQVKQIQQTELDIAQRYHDLSLWLHLNRRSWQSEDGQLQFKDVADADYYADQLQKLEDQISHLQNKLYLPISIAAKAL